jgi:hypothetical protein
MASTVTCHVEGCSNDGVPIVLDLSFYDERDGSTSQVDRVVCGACGVVIEDVVEQG